MSNEPADGEAAYVGAALDEARVIERKELEEETQDQFDQAERIEQALETRRDGAPNQDPDSDE